MRTWTSKEHGYDHLGVLMDLPGVIDTIMELKTKANSLKANEHLSKATSELFRAIEAIAHHITANDDADKEDVFFRKLNGFVRSDEKKE